MITMGSSSGSGSGSGSATPVLRYFCSQIHCEEGKEEHDVTMQMHSMEFRQAVAELKILALEFEIELEQRVFDRKADYEPYQMSGSYRNKTLKEILQLEKQKRARLALIFERFKVQKLLEMKKLELLCCKERVIMLRERIGKHHQKDVLAVQEQEEADQPSDAAASKIERQLRQEVRLELEEMWLSKQLDAINTMCDSNDEGWSPATMSKTEVCNMTLSKSLQNGREEYNALVLNFNEQVRANEQKLHELNEGLKRERENYEMKAVELDTDLLKSQGTREIEEKDAMEMQMKWETSKPRQTWRKKELEIQQEKIVAIELPQKRSTEALYLRDLNMRDEEDAYFREIFSDCGSEEKERLWQKVLSDRQVSREKRQTDLLNVREQIRVLEERVISIGEELDAVNLALAGDDEGRAIIIPYMAVPDPNPSNPNAGFVNS